MENYFNKVLITLYGFRLLGHHVNYCDENRLIPLVYYVKVKNDFCFSCENDVSFKAFFYNFF